MSGKQKLYDFSPGFFRTIKRAFAKIRVDYFTKSVDESGMDMRVDCSIDRLETVLGNAYFTNSWELSWHYRGEQLNMRRPKRYDDKYEWYQTHVRAYVDDDGVVRLEVHEDLEPTEYPYYHLHPPDDSLQTESAAMQDVGEILDDAGIEYESIRS